MTSRSRTLTGAVMLGVGLAGAGFTVLMARAGVTSTSDLGAVLLDRHAVSRRTNQPVAWSEHLRAVDAALARGDVRAATSAWREGYGAALTRGGAEGMLQVGHAARRIGVAEGRPDDQAPKARQAYLTALFRARQAGDVDTVLRVADAFAALGDRQVAHAALDVADRLAGSNADAGTRIKAAERRIDDALGEPPRARRAAAPRQRA